jgi:CubicO group peptidase (beta-lactamase class C family)
LLLFIGCSQFYERQYRDIAKEITSVETGLRSSVQFINDHTWNIDKRMTHYGVPGVSIAVIKDYKIHWIKHYGVTDKETGLAVDAKTLFQAGSISKPVAAYAALKYVELKKLALDEAVNNKLVEWKIPDNEFANKLPVALKHLLNHSAGVTVHGFGGYPTGVPVPTVIQVLNGVIPANSAAVRVDMQPETQYRYSGGGYTVMQKLVSDVAWQDYPQAMQTLVLGPIGMTQSTYEHPLPAAKLKYAAAGYLPNQSPVVGKRHTCPEMAAAGLWTTAEDLAKFVIDVQLAVKEDKGKVLSQSMTNKMLTPFVSDHVGLGFFIEQKNNETYFRHGGWDEGFSADLIAHISRDYGVVIMTNSNHPAFIDELKNSVASYYKWHQFLDPNLIVLPISETEQQRVIGRYHFAPDMIFSIFAEDNHVYMQYLNGERMEIFRIGENQFVRRQHSRKFRFDKNKDSERVDLVFGINNEKEFVHTRLKANEKVPLEW